MRAAEFRGPGIHHRYDDSPEDFDMEMMAQDHRARSFGNLSGRIILLGDGTEIDPNGPDADMFDHEDEDGDLEHQVNRVEEVDDDGEERRQREGTPGPEKAKADEAAKGEESPSSVATEKSEDKKAAPAAAVEKPKDEEKKSEVEAKA